MNIYHPVKDLEGFVLKATDFCPELDSNCIARVRGLLNAASIDFTYDQASQVLKVTALWPLSEQKVAVPASELRRTEVGILSEASPPNMDLHNIGLGGRLIILGVDKKDPEPTLFNFPSRHRPAKSHFSITFPEPTGLHPIMQLKLSSSEAPSAGDDCKPYAYLSLPKAIFADRYQLDDSLFMASKNLSSLEYSSSPVDLEAPAYTMDVWGSNILVQLARPPADKSQQWTVEIPLHLRYLEPSASGERQVDVPYPAVFWACRADDQSEHINPFDRTKLGYDDHFSRNTIFWHVEPRPEAGDSNFHAITVPVLKEQASPYVGIGTAAVIAAGFAWVLWKLIGVYGATGHGASSQKVAADAKAKKNN